LKKKFEAFVYINHVFAIALMLFALPLNNNLMSIAGFWLASAWLVDLVYEWTVGISPLARLRRAFSNPTALAYMTLFGLCILGFLWSEDFKFAQWDARTKVPLFFIPLVLSSYQRIERRHIVWCLYVLLISLSIAITSCTGRFYKWWGPPYLNVRDISHFISHIRFSLLIVFGIVLLIWFAKENRRNLFWVIPLIFYFIFFLWILQSVTGFAILLALAAYWILFHAWRTKRMFVRGGLISSLLVFISLVVFFVNNEVTRYFNPKDAGMAWQTHSAGGEIYDHRWENTLLENGHYVWRNLAWNELRRSWNKRSETDFDSLDRSGQLLGGTLIRYLTSKGLNKDSVGMGDLSDLEIEKIELGIATAYTEDLQGIKGRIRKILFEFDNYRNGGDPSGNSVLQRFEFWRAAWCIIKEYPLKGVGTGDLKLAYAAQYEKMDTALDPQYRLRAHNQYFTYGVAYGIPGVIIFIAVLLILIFHERRYRDLLFMSYIIIMALSFITEDTLETQAGVTFVAFLGPLLAWLSPSNYTGLNGSPKL